MTIAGKQFLSSFDSLPDADKHEVAVEILRRFTSSEDLLDETLVAAAEELFCAMDAEEAKNAQP